MPVQSCTLDGKPGWRWGTTGTCYTYDTGDDAGSAAAKKKAVKQAIAIHSNTDLSELYRLAETAEAGKAIPMMLFPVGTWKSASYPKLDLSHELAEEVIANFEAGVLGTLPVVDSSGKHDESTQAAGWIKRVYLAPTTDDGEALFADWEPTDLGAELLNSKRYVYNSLHIDTHVDNATGKRIPNVLKGATLCNTPVLRMLPPVLEAGEHIAASECVSIALSELSAAEDDPVATLLDEMDALAAKLDEALKGKKGMPAMRTMLREVRAKASAHKLADDSYNELRESLEKALGDITGERSWVADFGDDWVVYESSSLEEPTRTYRVTFTRDANGLTFGAPVEVERHTTYVPTSTTAPGASVGTTGEPVASSVSAAESAPGTNHTEERDMSELTELLKLSESADESVILAEVQKMKASLSEVTADRDAQKSRANAAEAKLAEGEKADRARKLDESIAAGHILPAEKDAMLALAESSPETFEATLTAREGVKVIDLSEHGEGGAPGETTYDDPTVELAEKAKARAAKDGIGYTAAERLVLSESKDLAERVHEHRYGRKEA